MALQFTDTDQYTAAELEAEAPPAPPRYAWLVFALTFGLMLSDYMSRQVINAVFPALKAEWSLSDTQLGALVSVVSLTVGVMAFPVAFLADRWGRVRSAALMALVWGVATIACGLAGNFLAMFFARAMVGLGEAGYGSAGGAVLLGVFPRRQHATVMGTFLAAGLFGSVLGVMLGGLLAESYGWRTAFIAIGAAGLLLAVAYPMVVREPARPGPEEGPPRLGGVIRTLLTTPTALWTYFGSGTMMFIQGSLVAWMPTYLNRYHGMSLGEAGIGAGVLVLLAGVGMTGGGALVDRLSRRHPLARLWVPMVYAAVSSLLLLTAFALPHGLPQLVLIGVAMLIAAGFAGPVGAVLAAVTPVTIHASTLAMLALGNNVLGLAPGPFATGLVADMLDLRTALQLVPVMGLLGAFGFWRASEHFMRDALHG